MDEKARKERVPGTPQAWLWEGSSPWVWPPPGIVSGVTLEGVTVVQELNPLKG